MQCHELLKHPKHDKSLDTKRIYVYFSLKALFCPRETRGSAKFQIKCARAGQEASFLVDPVLSLSLTCLGESIRFFFFVVEW